MKLFNAFYSSLPTRVRQEVARAIVCDLLASYTSRAASFVPGSVLQRSLGRIAPVDPCVFLADILQLRYFHVNGHVWVVAGVERRGKSKRTRMVRVYFRRLD